MHERKVQKLEKVLIATVFAAAAMIGVFMTGRAWFYYEWNGGSFKSFASYTSEDGHNHISIKARDPQWPFGSQDFQITMRGKNCGKKTITTSLRNDGKQSSAGDEVKTGFTDNARAVIVFDGEEQRPETIEIFFDRQNHTIEIVRTREWP